MFMMNNPIKFDVFGLGLNCDIGVDGIASSYNNSWKIT